MTQAQPKKSDLGVRVASAVVMVAVAGTALWLGGWVWTAFVAVIGFGVFWEWRLLVRGFNSTATGQIAWLAGGICYVGFVIAMLIALRGGDMGTQILLMIVFSVIGTDVGAYFAGRAIGGPKIAPAISPSKTWSGLVGGVIGAALMILLASWAWSYGLCNTFDWQGKGFGFEGPCYKPDMEIEKNSISGFVLAGLFAAVVAQTGDFFESWMKRRAGVKDSGNLIPGHGGLFDRVDGLIAVTFAFGMLQLVSTR